MCDFRNTVHGCARIGHWILSLCSLFFVAVCATGASLDHGARDDALQVQPAVVFMDANQRVAIVSVVVFSQETEEPIALAWEVEDSTLGEIAIQRGLTAVYRRKDVAGDNRIMVRDETGRAGEILVQQSWDAAEFSAAEEDEPLPIDEEDTVLDVLDDALPEDEHGEEIDAVVQEDVEGDDVADLPATDPSPAARSYTLLVGDEIQLEIFREPDLSGKYRVETSGVIRHALFGSIQVAGLTVAQAERAVANYLGERYLVNPRVAVRVLSSQASQVLVMGEVRSPGTHQIAFEERTTLLEVIASAGGFTDLASVNRVRVIRQEDGRQRRIRVRVGRIVSGADPDFEVYANDVIMVPQTFF